MKLTSALFFFSTLSFYRTAQGQGFSAQNQGQGQGQGNGQGQGQGNGQGNGQGSNSKPPGNSGGTGNGSGRPCGVGVGPASNMGADKRSSKASAHFDDLPRTCDGEDKIDIKLSNGKTKTFHKGRSTSPGLGRPGSLGYWFGTDEDGGSFNFVRGKSGLVQGSFTDLETGDVYQFGADAEGNQVAIITPTDEFPPEADPIEESPTSRGLKESEVNESLASHQGLRGIQRNLEEQAARRLGDDSGGNLDVMVIWTKKAECYQAGQPQFCTVTSATYDNMQALVELAVSETNTAYTLSGVHTQLNLVHSDRHDTYVETSFNQALNDLTGTSDGKMDEIHAIRDEVGADIVALLIEDNQYCGMGWLGPSVGSMFSVTKSTCATGYYSFGHEVGHNLGLNHDRGTKNACSSSASNYGWRDPGASFRSIMAYDCVSGQCDNNPGVSCPKVQMFSNIQFTHNGKAVGSPVANNAAKINQVAAEVAAYKPHKGGSACGSQQKAFRLVLTLDDYPDETTWDVKDSTGNVILSGGPYSRATQKGEVIEVDTCLPDAQSTFEIRDSYGDGTCCGYGQGGYQVYWDGALKKSGGSFGSSESTTLGGCANYPNWYDSYGDNCSWYENNEDPGCPYWKDKANAGLGTPGQACCHCGGGNDA